MLRLIGAAAVMALAAANPSFAQGKGNGGGKDHGGDHAGMNHGPGNSGKDNGGGGKADKPGKPARDGGAGNDRGRSDRVEQARGDRGNGRIERANEIRDSGPDRVIERTVVVRDRDLDRRDGNWDRRSDWDGKGDWDGRGQVFASVPGCPPGLAKKNNGCLPPGLAKANYERDRYFGYDYRPTLFGIPLRTRAEYAYYDGYLVPASNSGLSYIPLLGGALAVGQMWPQAYPTLQLADWQQDYYGFDDPRDYRYADNVVYQVDPETSAIESVIALLTGNDFAVGQRMPQGYDVYNVPGAYQDRYYDTDDAMYRYADGQVLQIDPTTMLIQQVIELIV